MSVEREARALLAWACELPEAELARLLKGLPGLGLAGAPGGGGEEQWRADGRERAGGADVALPVKLVHAADGKSARAEPVAALFKAGRAKLAGRFPELEDEMCALVLGGGYEGKGSPDRADAMVWAMTELMLGERRAEPRIRSF
jgi:hypothetical protein